MNFQQNKSVFSTRPIFTFLLFIFCLAQSCDVPQHLAMPQEFKDYTKGLYMECLLGGQKFTGEIITVNEKEVILLLLDSRNTLAIPKESITNFDVVVSLTSNDPDKVGKRAGLVLLPVIAHGWWMIITLPINTSVAVGNAAGAAKGTYRMKYPNNVSWDMLQKFARFPQGMPEGLSLEHIR